MRILKRAPLMFNRQLVAAAALGLFASVLTPVHAVEKEDAKTAKARADMKVLQTAIAKFRADTAAWPNRVDGRDAASATVEVLYSEGKNIASPGTWPVDNPLVYKQISSFFAAGNDRNYSAEKWKGPYLGKAVADPWGNTYLIAVKNLEKADLPVWIISAGPDGVLQTPIDSPVCMDGTSLDPVSGLVAAGDDVCLKFK
jgi:hypothetical protein